MRDSVAKKIRRLSWRRTIMSGFCCCCCCCCLTIYECFAHRLISGMQFDTRLILLSQWSVGFASIHWANKYFTSKTTIFLAAECSQKAVSKITKGNGKISWQVNCLFWKSLFSVTNKQTLAYRKPIVYSCTLAEQRENNVCFCWKIWRHPNDIAVITHRH